MERYIIKLLSARVKEEMWCCEHHANLTVMPGTQDRGCGYFMWMDDLRLHISSSSGSSTPPSYSPGTSTRPSYSPGSSRSAQNLGKAECSNWMNFFLFNNSDGDGGGGGLVGALAAFRVVQVVAGKFRPGQAVRGRSKPFEVVSNRHVSRRLRLCFKPFQAVPSREAVSGHVLELDNLTRPDFQQFFGVTRVTRNGTTHDDYRVLNRVWPGPFQGNSLVFIHMHLGLRATHEFDMRVEDGPRGGHLKEGLK
ncbi:hypothetical protein Tco_0849754 [Tanacetum coccineum]